MLQSDEAFDRGEMFDAVTFARRASAWWYPGAEHIGAALSRMEATAAGAASRNDAELRDYAVGAIISSVNSLPIATAKQLSIQLRARTLRNHTRYQEEIALSPAKLGEGKGELLAEIDSESELNPRRFWRLLTALSLLGLVFTSGIFIEALPRAKFSLDRSRLFIALSGVSISIAVLWICFYKA